VKDIIEDIKGKASKFANDLVEDALNATTIDDELRRTYKRLLFNINKLDSMADEVAAHPAVQEAILRYESNKSLHNLQNIVTEAARAEAELFPADQRGYLSGHVITALAGVAALSLLGNLLFLLGAL